MSFLDDVEGLRTKAGFSPNRKIVVAGLALVLLVVVILGAQLAWGLFTSPGPAVDESSLVIEKDEAPGGGEIQAERDQAPDQKSGDGVSAQETAVPSLYVHVAGAVARPGLYTLEEGSRVQDAIDAAGGLTKEALDQSINLARVVTDGEQIIVASKTDASSSMGSSAHNNSNSAASGSSSQSGGTAASGSSFAGNEAGKININQASADELTTLKGVGQATAAKIIAYREEHGAFKRIEDIKQVSGIGDKKFSAIKDSITV